MKKILNITVCLLISLMFCGTVVLAEDTEDVNFGIKIVEKEDLTIAVEVSKDVADKKPIARINCGLEEPCVKYNGVIIHSSFEDNVISFETSKPGIYNIVPYDGSDIKTTGGYIIPKTGVN